MKRLRALALLAFISSLAHAVPTLELKDTPPLKPLHYCKDANGQVTTQSDDCPLGTTEVSSIMTPGPDGKNHYAPLGTTMDSTPPPAPQAAPVASVAQEATASATPAASDQDVMRKGRKSLLKALAFGLAGAVAMRLRGRSMIIGFILGVVVEIVLVAAAVISP